MRRVLPVFPLLLTACGTVGLSQNVVADGDALVSVDPAGQIHFDEASPSGRSQSSEIVVSSLGDVPAYVADAWIESSTDGVFFTGDDLPFPKSMDPGEEIPITVRFQPTAAGTFHGSLVIESGLDGTLIERALIGKGCSDSDHDGDC
jgi:hypothetical protein